MATGFDSTGKAVEIDLSGKKEIDPAILLELINSGMTRTDMSKEIGISTNTLKKRVADLKEKTGILTEYRALQSLQLTELQARCLEAITPEKIDDAPLKDLVLCFKILKDRELVIDGKPSEISGLVEYLIEIERREMKVTLEGQEKGEVKTLTKMIEDDNIVDLSMLTVDNEDFD